MIAPLTPDSRLLTTDSRLLTPDYSLDGNLGSVIAGTMAGDLLTSALLSNWRAYFTRLAASSCSWEVPARWGGSVCASAEASARIARDTSFFLCDSTGDPRSTHSFTNSDPSGTFHWISPFSALLISGSLKIPFL